MERSPGAWYSRLRAGDASDPLVYFFAHAGGSSSAYGFVARSLPISAEIRGVDLPGRERRIGEPSICDMAELTRKLCEHLELPAGRPLLFVGHSLGALVAFELATRLYELGAPVPRRLLLTGREAPGRPPRRPALHLLSDAELVQELRRYGGTPEEVLSHEELLALVLRALRTDLALNATTTLAGPLPLPCSITCAAGREDTDISDDDLRAWGELTASCFRFERIEGGHFFVFSARRYRDLLSEELLLL